MRRRVIRSERGSCEALRGRGTAASGFGELDAEAGEEAQAGIGQEGFDGFGVVVGGNDGVGAGGLGDEVGAGEDFIAHAFAGAGRMKRKIQPCGVERSCPAGPTLAAIVAGPVMTGAPVAEVIVIGTCCWSPSPRVLTA
jgi:hypothetical protein